MSLWQVNYLNRQEQHTSTTFVFNGLTTVFTSLPVINNAEEFPITLARRNCCVTLTEDFTCRSDFERNGPLKCIVFREQEKHHSQIQHRQIPVLLFFIHVMCGRLSVIKSSTWWGDKCCRDQTEQGVFWAALNPPQPQLMDHGSDATQNTPLPKTGTSHGGLCVPRRYRLVDAFFHFRTYCQPFYHTYTSNFGL